MNNLMTRLTISPNDSMSDLPVGNPKGDDQTSDYTQHAHSNEII